MCARKSDGTAAVARDAACNSSHCRSKRLSLYWATIRSSPCTHPHSSAAPPLMLKKSACMPAFCDVRLVMRYMWRDLPFVKFSAFTFSASPPPPDTTTRCGPLFCSRPSLSYLNTTSWLLNSSTSSHPPSKCGCSSSRVCWGESDTNRTYFRLYCPCRFCINIAYVMLIRSCSPLTSHITGSFKSALQVTRDVVLCAVFRVLFDV